MNPTREDLENRKSVLSRALRQTLHGIAQPLTTARGTLELLILHDRSVEACHHSASVALAEMERVVAELMWIRDLTYLRESFLEISSFEVSDLLEEFQGEVERSLPGMLIKSPPGAFLQTSRPVLRQVLVQSANVMQTLASGRRAVQLHVRLNNGEAQFRFSFADSLTWGPNESDPLAPNALPLNNKDAEHLLRRVETLSAGVATVTVIPEPFTLVLSIPARTAMVESATAAADYLSSHSNSEPGSL